LPVLLAAVQVPVVAILQKFGTNAVTQCGSSLEDAVVVMPPFALAYAVARLQVAPFAQSFKATLAVATHAPAEAPA
jgi:hypothetical protein